LIANLVKILEESNTLVKMAGVLYSVGILKLSEIQLVYSIHEFGKIKEQGKRGSVLGLQNSQQMIWYTEMR